MPATLYARNKFLDHSLGLTTWTKPTTYVSLFNGDPEGAGVEVEVTAVDGYNRQALTIDAAAAGATQNNGAITFGPNTGAGSWTVTHFGVHDAQTPGTGNRLWSGAITNRTVATNESYTIPDADLDFSAT